MSVEPPSHLSQLSPGRRCDLVEKPLNFRDLSGALFSRHLEPFRLPKTIHLSLAQPAARASTLRSHSTARCLIFMRRGFSRAVRFLRGGRCGILGNRFRESRMVVHEQRQLNPR